MGRRIPKSRRHKKLKFVDPCCSEQRINIRNRKPAKNEPPKHEDFQEVPHNMRELIDIKNRVKQNKLKKLRKKKKVLKDDFIIVKREKIESVGHGMTKPLKPVPEKLVQKPNESTKHFFSRLQDMADLAIAEAEVERKYEVDLVHVDDKNVAVVPSQDPEVETIKKKRSKQSVKKRKKRKTADDDDEKPFRDTVKFGEVVLEPPTLLAKPRKAVGTEKPGVRDLHLMKMLNSNELHTAENKRSALQLKRKDLSAGQIKALEEERVRVVNLYRSLKQRNKPSVKIF